jgi:hypothetical protein
MPNRVTAAIPPGDDGYDQDERIKPHALYSHIRLRLS